MALAGYYGLQHPNRNAQARGYGQQWAHSTRQGVRVDIVVVHSAESIPDTSGPDNGAENVSRYMTTTNRSVSWHATSDSDSVIWNCPPGWTCFHAGSGWNRRAWGIEQAYQAGDFARLPAGFRRGTMDNTAQAVAVACGLFGIPVDYVTRADIQSGRRGITAHGTGHGVTGLQPGNVRSDPGWDADDWRFFLGRVASYVDAVAVGLGSSGDGVKAAQSDLNSRASAGLTVDGVFGPLTHRAVMLDQQSAGSSLTGVWSRLTVPNSPPAPDDDDTAELPAPGVSGRKLRRAFRRLDRIESDADAIRRLLSN